MFDDDTADEESDGMFHFIIFSTKTKIYAFDPLKHTKPFVIGDGFENIGYIVVDNNIKWMFIADFTEDGTSSTITRYYVNTNYTDLTNPKISIDKT